MNKKLFCSSFFGSEWTNSAENWMKFHKNYCNLDINMI